MGLWSFKDVADVMGLSESSARRWMYNLEKAGYQFGRKEKRRKLTDEDMLALMKLKLLSQNMSLEEACVNVANECLKSPPIDSDYLEAKKSFDEELNRLEFSIFWDGNMKSIKKVQEMWNVLKQKERHI